MRETIMFLTSPRRCLGVVERPNRLSPGGLNSHLGELTVLDHHRVDDTQEGFVAGEESGSSCEDVALHHSLQGMLREDLDDSAAFAAACFIPLEVAPSDFKHCAEFVGFEFVRREDTEGLGVPGGMVSSEGGRDRGERQTL